MSIDVNTMEIRRSPTSTDDFPMTAVYSKIDDGYVGTLEWAEMLTERGIAPQKRDPDHNVCSIGFCEKEQKWYGWSHRAMCGFGIGSEVKRGDCAYVADTPEGLIEDRYEFFRDISEECGLRHKAECQILPDRSGIRILHAPLMIPVADSFEQVSEALDGEVELPMVDLHDGSFSIQKCGRGEWRAETLADAEQMARDFAESVS